MKISKTFFNAVEDPERGWLRDAKPLKMPCETRVNIENIELDFISDIQNALHDTTKKFLKELSITGEVIFLELLGYYWLI